MFIVKLTYVKSLDEVEKHFEDHAKFLDEYYEQDKFIVSGRLNPRTGGIIFMKVGTREEVLRIIEDDPFHKFGVADYEIIEFLPTKHHKQFSSFVD
ncbi:YciI family protein [Alicyclobacillus dauci]|uniref:YciI family protein n=1 Tax=Alicyclobacillus dauci TaxID=1475485 RepID=A0ABY6Z474_9BACL|nr:YciI family protein [Alicyclobacillus dauci]WAH37462.1 YciI family protein [Alicyclobacillus dauci]